MRLFARFSRASNATYYIATTRKFLQMVPILKVMLKLKTFSTYHSFTKHAETFFKVNFVALFNKLDNLIHFEA